MIFTNKIYHSSLCNICLDDYNKDEPNECLLLKCGHIFHKSCAERWIEDNENCPTCRSVTFLPILLKDIVARACNQGMDGAKTYAKYFTIATTFGIGLLLLNGTLNYFYLSEEEYREVMDDAMNANAIFDTREPKGYLRLALALSATMGSGAAYYFVNSLRKQRNQIAQAAKELDYIPPHEG